MKYDIFHLFGILSGVKTDTLKTYQQMSKGVGQIVVSKIIKHALALYKISKIIRSMYTPL